jgi:hypothetical protein
MRHHEEAGARCAYHVQQLAAWHDDAMDDAKQK